MSGADVRDVLARLEAAGVRLALTEAGDALRVLGKGRPAPDLLEAVREHKPALLAFLRGHGEEEGQRAAEEKGGQSAPTLPAGEDLPEAPAPASLPSPDAVGGVAPVRVWKDGKPRSEDGRLDMGAVLARPGHCGNCRRFQPAPEEGTDMGRCLTPARLWPADVSPPLAIHAAHRCAVQGGRGWQAAQGFEDLPEGQPADRGAA